MKRSTARAIVVSAVCLLGICFFLRISTGSPPRAVAAGEDLTGTVANSAVSFEVVQSRGFSDESEDYYIVKGILKNTGSRTATNIYVKAEIFWEPGIKRGEATRQADIKILRPGETSPFQVRVSYVAPYLIDYYTLDVAGVETTKQPYVATAITQDHLMVRDQYRYVYGEIINLGPRTVDGDDFSVYTVFFDSQGRLLDRDYYSIRNNLAPSWTSPFRARTSLFNQVDSYEIWIQADVFEEGVYPVDLSAKITETEPFLLSSLIVTGTITNNSDVSAVPDWTWGRLVFVYRDSQGRVKDFESSLMAADIGPGETQVFSDILWPPDEYSDLQLYAFGPATTAMIPPTIIRALDVFTLGEGDVEIDPTQASYVYGDVVTLIATPDTGWVFAGWSGHIHSTDNPLVLTIHDDMELTATFTEGEYTLDLSIIGEGIADVDPEQDTYVYGDVVILTATADTGWTFGGWTGDRVSTDNPLELTIQDDTAITATFTQNEYTLAVTLVGEGDVEVDPDQDTYHYDDVVTLMATADPGWTFAIWTGDVESTDNPLELTIQDDTELTATFTQDEYTLEVDIVGEGDVDIEPEQDTYVYGDVVMLTATAHPNWTFVGWSGDVDSTANPLELTIEGDTTITATFEPRKMKVYLPLVLTNR